MTKASQKRRERHYASRCAEILGEPWELRDDDDCERPDFVVSHAGGVFGLEVCEIFSGPISERGSARKREEATRQKVIGTLRREYEDQASNTPLRVHLVGDLCKANVARVVPDLIAADLAGKPPLYKMIIDNDEGLRVHVTRSLRPSWIYIGDRVGWVDRDPLPRILDAVVRKAEDLEDHRRACGGEVRLLIYADRILNSGKLELQGEPRIDRMGFSVVYFLSYPQSVTVL